MKTQPNNAMPYIDDTALQPIDHNRKRLALPGMKHPKATRR
jgi:hypothetical protein